MRAVFVIQVPLVESKGVMKSAEPVWAFKNASLDTTRLMNLVNLPMVESLAAKRLMAVAKVTADQKAAQSLKEQIKDQFQKSMDAQKPKPEAQTAGPNASDANANVAAKPGEANNESSSSKNQKRAPFSANSKQEKDMYDLIICSVDETEKRALTALDELILAMAFAVWYSENLSDKGKPGNPTPSDEASPKLTAAEKQSKRARAISCMIANLGKYDGTLGFVVRLWFLFLVTEKVALNGRECRFYTSLRLELQIVVVKSHEKLFMFNAGKSSSSEGIKGDKQKTQAPVDAIELAAMLCNSFCSGPIHAIDGEDADADSEDQAKCRIIKFKADHPEMLQGLQEFISSKMKLPLALHDAPRAALSALAQSADQGSNSLMLVDVLAIMKTEIEKTVPFAWLVFTSAARPGWKL